MSNLNEQSTASLLPLKLQEYLWQLVGPLLKIKLSPGSYESTCVSFERVIYLNKTKELRELRRDVYDAITDLPRWTFVRGSLPYVIHGCTSILEQRRSLGLTDNFSVAVTKLFNTLHYILLEASQECQLGDSPLDLKSIELFVQNIIPCMQNLHESDLTFSLQIGMHLWVPLWNHFPPISTLLALPVVTPKKSDDIKKKNLVPTNSLFDENNRPKEATCFDVAVIKALSLDNWTFSGYKWGILYIEKYLKNLVSCKNIDETCYSIKITNRFTPSKSLCIGGDAYGDSRHNSPKLYQRMKSSMNEKISQKKVLIPETVPDEFLSHVTKSGELRLSNVLKTLCKLSKNEHLYTLSGNILYSLSLLIELALNKSIVTDLAYHYQEVFLSSLVSTIKMIGCEWSCLVGGMRGLKGDQHRLIMHEYLNRLLEGNEEKCKTWFCKYVSSEDLFEVLKFMHALTSFCKTSEISIQSPMFFEPAVHEGALINSNEFKVLRLKNEKLILRWISPLLFNRLTESWHEVVNNKKHQEYFSLVVQAAKFLRTEHQGIYRKLVTSGLLASFNKSKENMSPIVNNNSTENSPKLPEVVIKTHKNSKNAKKKFLTKLGTTVKNDDDPTLQLGSYPGTSLLGENEISEPMKSFDYMSSSLPRSFTVGSIGKKSSLGFMTLGPKNSPKLAHVFEKKQDVKLRATEKHQQRGKIINYTGLYMGLQQLRFLLEVSEIGVTPDETVIAAMLDLEAPVIARAAYLLEIANFVQKCNNDDWPTLLKFAQSGYQSKGIPHISTLNYLKHRAGILFHKWGVAIGRKLEDIIEQEKVQLDQNRFAKQESVDFMYEGDLSVITSSCPEALKFVACQLLLEITAYLRETFVTLLYIQITSEGSTPSISRPRTNTESNLNPGNRRPRHSIAAGLAKKISQVHQKKTSLGIILPTHSDSFNESNSSGSPNKTYISQSKLYPKKSPKVTRKQSRKFSRPSLSHSMSLNAAMMSEERDDVPDEMLDFPWLDVIILMNKSVDFLCTHSKDTCHKNCPLEQARSCSSFLTCLTTFYEVAMKEARGNNEITEKMQDPIVDYILKNVKSLQQSSYGALCKGVFVMENDQLVETMATSWEVLLHPDQHLKSAAASLFLVAAYKLEQPVSLFISKQLQSSDANDRAKALQRFAILWDNQLQVYDHLEESAKITLRIPSLKLDYTLPSRPFSEEMGSPPDAPWLPSVSNAIEFELSDAEEDTYFIADSELQKKTKMKSHAKKLKLLRENYMISSVPYSDVAFVDYDIQEDEDAVIVNTASQGVQSFFPRAMGNGILHLIRLLDDTAITSSNNQPVNSLAYQMIWRFLVDSPEIFFQRFFEKITKIRQQDELILLLRKLLLNVPLLPSAAAHLLLEHLIGVVTYYDRNSKIGAHEKIASIMPLLPLLIGSVPKISFSDLKHSLKREHVDHTIMVTANIGSIKEIYVVYTNLKERLEVPVEMTFLELLHQCKELFELDGDHYVLYNKHSNMIMDNNSKLRDVFVYKRGFPIPTLKVEHESKDYTHSLLQKQVLTKKLKNISQLYFSSAIFNHCPNKKQVTFLYSELYQQPSFPRKAIDLEFDLCMGTELGKEIFGVDVILKDAWVQFISNLLVRLAESSPLGEEVIGFFLDPINGALLLHGEDVTILRTSLAALINIVRSYGKTFALDGYHEILPTMLRVYSQHEDNSLVKESIEFTIGQFFKIHQSPFLLQLFASVAPYLLTEDCHDNQNNDTVDLVPARCLFSLIESLERIVPDTLNIMSLICGETPIKPYDLSFEEDNGRGNKIDLSIRLALTIIAYKPESNRSLQMMFVLSALIPFYLKYLEQLVDNDPFDSNDSRKMVKGHLLNLIKYVNVIIERNEILINPYQNEGSISSDSSNNAITHRSSNYVWNAVLGGMSAIRNWFNASGTELHEGDDIERTSIMGDDENPLLLSATNIEERTLLNQYYQPRTFLLTLASDFTLKYLDRFTRLTDKKMKSKSSNNSADVDGVIEEDNSLILIDVAIAMLKLVYWDHAILKNQGLQRFILGAMPSIKWVNWGSFGKIVKRINKTFCKLLTKPDYLKYVEWSGFEMLVKGLYLTLKKQEMLAELPEMKALLHTCTRVIIGDVVTPAFDSEPLTGVKSPSSIGFNTIVVKLAARLIYSKPSHFNLQQDFNVFLQNTSTVKLERFFIHWLLPLCIRMGTGRLDYPVMESNDIQFVTSLMIANIFPKTCSQSPVETSYASNVSETKSELSMQKSLSFITQLGVTLGRVDETQNSLPEICFLGLKILLTIERKSFLRYWRILRLTVEKYINTFPDDMNLWKFLYFVVANRSPLMLHLLPTIKKKIILIDDFPEHIKTICNRIKHVLSQPPIINCRSSTLTILLNELSLMALSTQATNERQREKENAESVIFKKDFRLKEPPNPRRNVSTEETDKDYIGRVLSELRNKEDAEGGGSNRLTRVGASIMKRKNTENKHRDLLKKQVSFFDPTIETVDVKDGDEPPVEVHSNPVSPLKKQFKKLSKRTKMKMFKRQASADDEDDDEKQMIDVTSKKQRESVSSEECFTLDHQSRSLIKSSSTSSRSKSLANEETFAMESITNSAFETPDSPPLFSPTSSVDNSNDFESAIKISRNKARLVSTDDQKLMRSPVIKRKTIDDAAISIASIPRPHASPQSSRREEAHVASVLRSKTNSFDFMKKSNTGGNVTHSSNRDSKEITPSITEEQVDIKDINTIETLNVSENVDEDLTELEAAELEVQDSEL